MSKNDDEPVRDGLTNLMYWDRFVIVLAALLAACGYAFFFKPSFGTAMENVLETPIPVVAEDPPSPPQTPGVVETFIYPSTPNNAPARKQ